MGTVSVRGANETDSSFRGDGGSYFDFKVEWTSSNSANRFDSDFTLASFTVTGSGISANSFIDLGVGAGNSQGGLYTAAHVQGIGTGQSGWITGNPVIVPLPAGAWMGITGLASVGLFVARRRARVA